ADGGNSPCQVTAHLVGLTMFRKSTTPVLEPGGRWRSHWNNAHLEDHIYVVGAVGSEPDSGSCRIQVFTRYRTQPDGETEHMYEAMNVGEIACATELRHARVPVQGRQRNWTIEPGRKIGFSPARVHDDSVVLLGADPVANQAGACRFDITPARFNRRMFVDYRNTSPIACDVNLTWAEIN
ncbi:MAG TPA: hypothetical protein VFO77_09045, partial [Actinoplanes sp.]|nr:hypothetical protein [Actinoplanes sp.]